MQPFTLAHAGGESPDQVIGACLAQLDEVPPGANAGFVYATDALEARMPEILQRLEAHTGIDCWSGASGVGICATGHEYYDHPALAVMLASFDSTHFRRLPLQIDSLDAFLQREASWLAGDAFHFGVLRCDPAHPRSTALIDALAQSVAGSFCVGALASSRATNLVIADGVHTGGIAGLLFSSEVPVVTGHSQGCQPIGDRHVVTACERNILMELDGRPALDVFKQDIGEVLAQDLQRIGGYIFAALPIPGSDTSDYLVRNLIGLDVEQKLVAIGDIVAEGEEVMFCRRDGNSARADLQRMLDDIQGRLPGEARGALYFSCLGRGRYQFGDNSEELGMLRDTLGDIPLAGFFANGEIFHNRLYGYTGVLTVFC